MIKRRSLLIIVALLLFAELCSCNGSRKSITLWAKELYYADETSGIPGMYTANAEEGSEEYICTDDLCLLYGKDPDCPEMGYIEDFCIVYSKRRSAHEVHILLAGSESEAKKLSLMLKRRADALTQGEYTPVGGVLFGEKASEAVVYTKGKYAILEAGKMISRPSE